MFLTASSILNAILIGMMASYISQNAVFDIDLIRDQYMRDMRYYYKRGCHTGTDYLPEWRSSPHNWNEHSVPIYCDDMSETELKDIEANLYNLGRKNVN